MIALSRRGLSKYTGLLMQPLQEEEGTGGAGDKL